MNNAHKVKKEPLVHIVKRSSMPWFKSWGIRAIAITAALVVCAIITVFLTDENPFGIFVALFEGSFGIPANTWALLRDLSILLCIALAITPAFKMRYWNIGAEGQVIVGALAAAVAMKHIPLAFPGVPNVLLIVIMFVGAVLAGALWAFIPAIFKAYFNTNETLFTLMMNYIGIQLVAFYIAFTVKSGSGVVGIINMDTAKGWLPSIFNNKYICIILAVAVLTVLMFVYLKYSKQGYEISVVGESENTARYIGINVKKVILRTLCISGAICGIAGFLLVSGKDHTITPTIAGGRGFTAIMVSWLAKFNPIYMIFASFLIVFLERGAGEITSSYGLNDSFADILTGVILLFIIGSEFFINYRMIFRKAHKEVR